MSYAGPALLLPSVASTTLPPSSAALAQISESQINKANTGPDDLHEKAGKCSQPEESVTPEDDWESSPLNPRNWSPLKKWITVTLVAYLYAVSPLSTTMMSPGLPQIKKTYGIKSEALSSLTLSVSLLAFGFGPLLFAPLSEMYGRVWVLRISALFTLIFNLSCAFAPTVGLLIAFRFFAGFAGGALLPCGTAVIGDIFSAHERASALTLYFLWPTIIGAVGPIAGGYLTNTLGVKWVFIVVAAGCGLGTALAFLLLRETYAPVVLARRAKQIHGGDPETLSRLYSPFAQMGKMQYLWTNLIRPMKLLTRSSICFGLSLYNATVYALYYLMLSMFADVFDGTYEIGAGIGLVYLGLCIGSLVAIFTGVRFADQVYKHIANKNGGQGKPESRILTLILGACIVPVGLFWYGWSARPEVHWIIPIIGTGIFGFGFLLVQTGLFNYLVDAFGQYAASAVGAACFLRSIFAFAFPLFAHQMYDTLGYGGGNSLLGGLAIILGMPMSIWIYYHGEAIRAKSDLKL